MSNIFNINGKNYTEEEIINIYNFWQFHSDIDDINDAINEIIESNDEDKNFIDFVKENQEELRNLCIQNLSDWHDTQKDLINQWDKSIFDLSQDLVNHTYYGRTCNTTLFRWK